MSDKPWLKWYPADWRADPKLRMCSLAARGLWIEMLGFMHEAEPYGYFLVAGRTPSPKEIASLVGCDAKTVTRCLEELRDNGVFSADATGIFSRRMLRDKARDESNKTNGILGGNPHIPRGAVAKDERVRGFKRSDAPQKTMRVFNRSGGRCVWCGVELLFNPDGGPTGFHVDHVVAVCDGGTNDEDNLVAACAACNHTRARMDAVGRENMVMVGMTSDGKAQIPEARSQKPEAREEKHTHPRARRSGLSAEELSEFERFYREYPRKEDRGHAETAFLKARKTASLQQLISGAQDYARRNEATERRYVALPATWLNGRRWLDQSAETGNGSAVPELRAPRLSLEEAEREQGLARDVH